MSRSWCFLAAMGLVGIGVIAGLDAAGTNTPCLGTTVVECAKATGVIPGTGVGWPILALTIAAAGLILVPVPAGRRAAAALGAIAGGAFGAGAYLALRPRTMEGPDSTGAWISVALPVDPYALAASAIFGAFLGVVVARLVRQVLDTRQTGPDSGDRRASGGAGSHPVADP